MASTGNEEVDVEVGQEGNVENKDVGNDPSASEEGTADGAVPVNPSALGTQNLSLVDMTLSELRLKSYAIVEQLKTLRREVKSKDSEFFGYMFSAFFASANTREMQIRRTVTFASSVELITGKNS